MLWKQHDFFTGLIDYWFDKKRKLQFETNNNPFLPDTLKFPL